MKPPLYLLALPRDEERMRGRRAGRPRRLPRREPAWPRRWPRKLATAVPTSLRVLRQQLGTPLDAIDPGTPVVSTRGRTLGVVRSIVVDVDSGSAAYAVSQAVDDARVILLPRHAVRGDEDVAVIDDRLMRRLERRRTA